MEDQEDAQQDAQPGDGGETDSEGAQQDAQPGDRGETDSDPMGEGDEAGGSSGTSFRYKWCFISMSFNLSYLDPYNYFV